MPYIGHFAFALTQSFTRVTVGFCEMKTMRANLNLVSRRSGRARFSPEKIQQHLISVNRGHKCLK